MTDITTITAREQADEAMRLAGQDPPSAVAAASSAARRASREGDVEASAVSERAWGHALLFCGDMDGAIRHLRTSVELGRRAGSATLVGEARMTLAFALIQRGRPQAALEEIDAAVDCLDGVAYARARAQRGLILRMISRLQEALVEFGEALDVLRSAGDRVGVQRLLINRAMVYLDLDEFGAAELDLHEAKKLAEELEQTLNLGLIAINLGVIETFRGDVPAALAYLDEAGRILPDGARAGGNQRTTAHVHWATADVLLSVGLVAEARAAAEQAAIDFQQQRGGLLLPEVLLLLTQVAFIERDWEAALRHARRAMREFSRQRRPDRADEARLHVLRAQLAQDVVPRISAGRLDTMIETLAGTARPAAALEGRLVAAQVAARRRRADRGRDYLRQASRSARGPGPAVLRARGWYAEALLRLNLGSARSAASAARRGLRILDEYSAAMGATDLRAHAAIHRSDLVELGLRIGLESGRPARVFEWAERGRASHLLHRPARPPDDPRLAGLLAELRAVARELAQHDDDGATRQPRLVRRQVELERAIRDHCRLRRGDSNSPAPGPVAPVRLGAALGEAVLIEFVQLDGVLYGVSLAQGRLRLRQLGTVSEVDGLIERLPFALHRLASRAIRPRSHAAALALLREAAARLDAMLLRPFDRELGDRPLVVVPTGVLHSVPWSILPSCAGRPVAVSPSATLWQLAGGQAARDGAVAVAAGPGLHSARSEADEVAAIHRTSPLVGEAATVEAVLAALASAGIAHLAAHGRLSAENPLFSDLLLADGPLIVYDVERLASVPHTVVLAACDIGRSVVRTGDELLGLSATFIGKGAAQLVASVLPVPDAETAPLMVAFHRALADGQPPAAALAAAQQQLAGDGPAALAAAAGFVCLGFGFEPPPAG